MKSPFPGMDPYLERHWHDVHHGLITYARDQLATILPQKLIARIEERAYVETEEGKVDVYPDVRVVEHPRSQRPQTRSVPSGIAVAEPIVVRVAREPVRQGYIQILDAASKNRVVTVIEFVSPSNKLPGPGRKLYRKKQKEVIKAGANLVEIDLTRTGKRSLAAPETLIDPSERATYLACVTRGWKRDLAELYPLRLAEPLPSLRIPLRKTDADAILNLQALVDECYEKGRYDIIDYSEPPKPPLDPEGAAWADKWLRAKGVLT